MIDVTKTDAAIWGNEEESFDDEIPDNMVRELSLKNLDGGYPPLDNVDQYTFHDFNKEPEQIEFRNKIISESDKGVKIIESEI